MNEVEIAATVRMMVPIVVGIALSVAFITSAYRFGHSTGYRKGRKKAYNARRRPLPHPDNLTVLDINDETGYGTAIIDDNSDGVDVVSFSDDDEIYQEVWIPGPVLEEAANELSVKACTQGGDDA